MNVEILLHILGWDGAIDGVSCPPQVQVGVSLGWRLRLELGARE